MNEDLMVEDIHLPM